MTAAVAPVLAGATGKLLFGAVGFVLSVPMLRRLRRRHGSWSLPGGLLAVMAVAFTFSTFVIGPALAGAGSADDPAAPAQTAPRQAAPDTRPPGVNPAERESHHP